MTTDQPMTHLNVLAFEHQWSFYRYAGRKEAAIVDTFGVTPTAYYQRLRQVVLAPSRDAVDLYGPLIRRVVEGMERQARIRGRAS